jgi:hypothetical protein
MAKLVWIEPVSDGYVDHMKLGPPAPRPPSLRRAGARPDGFCLRSPHAQIMRYWDDVFLIGTRRTASRGGVAPAEVDNVAFLKSLAPTPRLWRMASDGDARLKAELAGDSCWQTSLAQA